MFDIGARGWVILASELVALIVIYRAWRSQAHFAEKIALSLLALVPLIGPFLAWWLNHNPLPANPALRDYSGRTNDLLDRWRHVFEEKRPVVRQRKWQSHTRHGDDNEA